jgi:hypothetical protein
MGLTIHYDLLLPGTLSDADALAALERLRAHALTLGADGVSEICTLSGADICNDRDEWEVWSFERMIHIAADEGQYWETRSTERLLAEVRHSNRIMARLAGALHDANPELELEAPIFRDPDFERLETEPLCRRRGD